MSAREDPLQDAADAVGEAAQCLKALQSTAPDRELWDIMDTILRAEHAIDDARRGKRRWDFDPYMNAYDAIRRALRLLDELARSGRFDAERETVNDAVAALHRGEDATWLAIRRRA